MRHLGIGVVALLSTVLERPATGQDAAALQAFVKTQLQLSNSELSSLNQGRPVVKTLGSSMKREMTTVGGIRIQSVGMASFVEQFRTLEGFRTSQFVLQIRKFGEKPDVHDLDTLTVDEEDIDALRKCRVGECDVQLSAEDIRRFNTQVDWRSPVANAQAAALYRTVLFAHLTDYRAGGMPQLVRYNDREVPVILTAETTALLDGRPSLLEQDGGFERHVRSYPTGTAPVVQDFFYWSKEEFGFKPVIGLNHVSLHTDSSGRVLIATIQIYASHYMDGSVAVNALIPDARGGQAGFYWLYMNRSRIGRLGGLLGTLSRPIVQHRARAGLTKSLLQTKQRLEAAPK